MFRELCVLLERAALDKSRVKVYAKDGEVFTGISHCQDEGDDDLGWYFLDIEGSIYSNIHLKDIASVCRIDHPDICWTAPVEA